MTGAENMIALELDSQIQLLTRIQFVTRFSSHLVQISGEKGAGKTWISERYLESWAEEPIQSLLICHPEQKDPQHRAILLRQLVKYGMFNESCPLKESLIDMIDEQPIHALLVIDNAEYISSSMLSELWTLIIEAQRREHWQINVLLFSQTGKLNKWFHALPFGQGIKPIELEVSPLSQNERDTFIELLLVNQQLNAEKRRKLKHKLDHMPSLPGALLNVENEEVIPMQENKRLAHLPFILGAASVVVLAISLVWYLVSPSSQKPITAQPGSITQLTSSSPAPTTTNALSQESMPDKTSPSDPLLQTPSHSMPEKPVPIPIQITKPKTDDFSLPKESMIEGVTVGRADENQRIVVPDKIVTAIINEQAVGGDGTNVINKLSKKDKKDRLIATKNTTTPLPIQGNASPPQQTADLILPTAKTVPLSNQLLLRIPQYRFALQLAALQSREAVNDFVRDYQLDGQVLVYETRRSGEPWFMVLRGDYPTINSARNAINNLSSSVQSLGPWAKSFAQIHKEINRVN